MGPAYCEGAGGSIRKLSLYADHLTETKSQICLVVWCNILDTLLLKCSMAMNGRMAQPLKKKEFEQA